MRAFMSRDNHARFGAVRIFNGTGQDSTSRADLAEREARAILAETEPQGCGTYQNLTWLGDWSADVAEALEAFVGEPCQCAGGMHWSAEQGYYHCNGILSERN